MFEDNVSRTRRFIDHFTVYRINPCKGFQNHMYIEKMNELYFIQHTIYIMWNWKMKYELKNNINNKNVEWYIVLNNRILFFIINHNNFHKEVVLKENVRWKAKICELHMAFFFSLIKGTSPQSTTVIFLKTLKHIQSNK